jgi:hypothetical protein
MKIHRNITFKRLLLDLYQDFRSQKPVVSLLGRPFQRSRRFIEMDLTYRCNLKCQNCNRSCTQAPSNLEISLQEIDSFIRQSLDMNIKWERIRLLGGEPTLHSRFIDILKRLLEYRSEYNPALRLVVCTNGCGKRVNRILSRIPETVVIKNTFKNSQQRLFRPFNLAPLDRARFALADLTAGCRILKDCGIGLTPLGYYPCAIAGGIDRIFGHHFSRRNLPHPEDEMLDQLSLFCRYCGHFGFAWPTRKIRISPTWERAYRKADIPSRIIFSAISLLSQPSIFTHFPFSRSL